MTKILATAVLGVALLLGACSEASVSPAQPVDEPGENVDWMPLQPRDDLRGEQPLTPEEVVVAPDGNSVLVRFWGGVEPCFGARVEVVETDDSVEVQLITGLPPGAEATTCIALAVAYEIQVALTSPIGDRGIVVGTFVPELGVGPADGAVFETSQYLGLSQAEAEELARIEGRVFRIARLDDEWFALTEDFDPSRVNVEIEAGVVVAVEGW